MSNSLRVLLHNAETDSLRAALTSRYVDVEVATCETYKALPEMLEAFRPDIVYSVRFDGTPGFPKEALFGQMGPKWISNGGVGVDHFGSWDPGRVTVTNAAGVAADMMAEYIFGGFLHFTLNVDGLQADKAARRWQSRQVRGLKGNTLLVLGLGHTGQSVAARAKAFGMHVIGTRARPVVMDHVDEVHPPTALLDLLPRADFVAISVPLTPQTSGLIGADEISAMKPGVILADVSRGGVVDQTALATALDVGLVAAAVLDVFEVEPLPSDSPLWALGNVLLSPHCSSVYQGWEDASFDMFLDNLGRWMAGDALLNVVDPTVGY